MTVLTVVSLKPNQPLTGSNLESLPTPCATGTFTHLNQLHPVGGVEVDLADCKLPVLRIEHDFDFTNVVTFVQGC